MTVFIRLSSDALTPTVTIKVIDVGAAAVLAPSVNLVYLLLKLRSLCVVGLFLSLTPSYS